MLSAGKPYSKIRLVQSRCHCHPKRAPSSPTPPRSTPSNPHSTESFVCDATSYTTTQRPERSEPYEGYPDSYTLRRAGVRSTCGEMHLACTAGPGDHAAVPPSPCHVTTGHTAVPMPTTPRTRTARVQFFSPPTVTTAGWVQFARAADEPSSTGAESSDTLESTCAPARCVAAGAGAEGLPCVAKPVRLLVRAAPCRCPVHGRCAHPHARSVPG
jgi:hypothetical protein